MRLFTCPIVICTEIVDHSSSDTVIVAQSAGAHPVLNATIKHPTKVKVRINDL